MEYNFIPAVICPQCGKVSELPDGDPSDPFDCPRCHAVSAIGKRDCRLMKPEEFESARQL